MSLFFNLTYDRLVILCVLLGLISFVSLLAVACLLISRRHQRRKNREQCRSLRNLHARDQGAAILPTITKA